MYWIAVAVGITGGGGGVEAWCWDSEVSLSIIFSIVSEERMLLLRSMVGCSRRPFLISYSIMATESGSWITGKGAATRSPAGGSVWLFSVKKSLKKSSMYWYSESPSSQSSWKTCKQGECCLVIKSASVKGEANGMEDIAIVGPVMLAFL